MNPEQLEDVLVDELPRHVSNYWNVRLTDFGDGSPQDAIVAFEDVSFEPTVAGSEDPRFTRQSIDDALVSLQVHFISAKLAPRAVFDDVYREVKRCVVALSKARQELWTLGGMSREVGGSAEEPTRTLIVDINVAMIAGTGR